jgi:competence protein ComEC
LTALAPLAAALALRIWSPRTTLASLAIACPLALSLGFALAKLRVEWVRAPVLAKQINSVEVRGYVELVEPRPSGGHV